MHATATTKRKPLKTQKRRSLTPHPPSRAWPPPWLSSSVRAMRPRKPPYPCVLRPRVRSYLLRLKPPGPRRRVAPWRRRSSSRGRGRGPRRGPKLGTTLPSCCSSLFVGSEVLAGLLEDLALGLDNFSVPCPVPIFVGTRDTKANLLCLTFGLAGGLHHALLTEPGEHVLNRLERHARNLSYFPRVSRPILESQLHPIRRGQRGFFSQLCRLEFHGFEGHSFFREGELHTEGLGQGTEVVLFCLSRTVSVPSPRSVASTCITLRARFALYTLPKAPLFW